MTIALPPVPEDTSKGFTIQVTAEVRPGKADEWLAHFRSALKLVAAEPECVLFELFRCSDNPNKFTWVETWTISFESFMKDQATKPYRLPYEEKATPLLVGDRQVQFLERLDKA